MPPPESKVIRLWIAGTNNKASYSICSVVLRITQYPVPSTQCPAKTAAYHVAMDVKDLFVKQKAAIRARSEQAFALIHAQHMDWRPEPGALTVGEMLQHLWVSEEGVRRVALDGNFAYYETRIPQGLRATLSSRALEENLANLSRVHNETLAAVRTLPLDKFEEERAHEGLGFRRKIGIILFGINEHEIHHRAQLMTYLRMLGTPVPEAVARR
jgi:uncharacterized damage-inducible protein DinB